MDNIKGEDRIGHYRIDPLYVPGFFGSEYKIYNY